METILNLTLQAANETLLSLWHNWPFLLVSVLIAAALKLFLDPGKVSTFLQRYRNTGVLAATTIAVATPLCSCGTTAVVLGMMASMMPWAPIIAFMVASPLTSPEELIYSAGLFGWPFAITFFAASIILGLLGGLTGAWIDSRGWLKNQARMAGIASASTLKPDAPASTCSCGETTSEARPSECSCDKPAETRDSPCVCGEHNPEENTLPCNCAEAAPEKSRIRLQNYIKTALSSGKQLLLMFLGFAFIGYFLNGLIPSEWIRLAFGSGNFYSVPLAATLGLPFYISTEASLPLIRALLDSGMSQGAAMAFLISGAGTSIGAVAGALTIARWRVVAIVAGVLWVGAIAFGFVFNFLVAAGMA